MNELLLAYDLEHVSTIESYVRAAKNAPRVVALDFWVEQELTERGIPCDSFDSFRLNDDSRLVWLRKAQTIAREWYRLPEVTFFTHRNFALGDATEPAVDSYLGQLLYFFAPLCQIVAGYDSSFRVVIPNKGGTIAETAGSFAAFEVNAIVDSVRFLGKQQGFEVLELGERPTGEVKPFPVQPFVLRLFSVWNFCMRVFVPQRPLKIFASEQWSHIGPLMKTMDDAEMVLMERSEIRNIPLGQLLKHRTRFIHTLDIKNKKLRRLAKDKQELYKKMWEQQGSAAVGRMSEFTYAGGSWWPLVEPAFTFFVEQYAERLVYDAEAFVQIFAREKIQKVLLRASVSGHQPHFFIAAKIAASMGIPSIELQHAGAVLDRNSVHSRMEASYLAGYGTLTGSIYSKNHGYEIERFAAIGSPRFDRYLQTPHSTKEEKAKHLTEIGLDPERPVVLAAVPGELTILTPHAFDMFDVVNFFASMAQLQKMNPAIQVLFKFRSACPSRFRDYIHKLFGGKNYAIVSDDLYFRIGLSDIVISSNSSVMYETMIAQKPLLLYPWRKNDVALPVYQKAAPVAFSDQELSDLLLQVLTDKNYAARLVAQGTAFLKDNYSFDGKASERTADLLRAPLKAYGG